jgi:polyisoprenoid-binding protein YceI
MTYTALLLTALLAQTTASGPTTTTYSVQPQKSLLRYTIVHKFHKVNGQSKLVQGKAALKPDGSLQVMLRAPIGSFESGDGNRDQHMREALQEPKHPYVVFKGVAKLKEGTTSLPPKLDLVLSGELDFHGRKQPEKVSVHVESTGAGTARATGRFSVSLDRYQIERPSLLLIKIDDACVIEFELELNAGAR